MKTFYLLIAFLFNVQLMAQAPVNTFDAEVPNHYYDFTLKLVKETPGFTPPVAARAFGFMGLTLYEAMVPGMPNQLSSDGVIFGLNGITPTEPGTIYHWPTVANNALSMIIDSMFRNATPTNKDSLANIRTYYNDLFEYQLPAEVFDVSKTFGEAIAMDIFNYSRTDGGHNAFNENFPPEYVPPSGPSLWVPFGNQTCLQPYWGSHRPFIEIDTTDQTVSPPPPDFSTEPGSDFYNYANQVYITYQNLTPEQDNIARYWADGGGTITPGGHSISMLKIALMAENANLEMATLAYAKLGIALSDAFLACWKTKYIYNLCRPVTYIRQYIDTAWTPLIGTPPFPEYPSGHSSQSGAMATILTAVFGENYAFTDNTHGDQYGGPRSFSSFTEAAEEAAISRLYGGIHFEFGNQAGLELGIAVGTHVNALFDALTTTSTGYQPKPVSLSIYPNPANDHLSIAWDAFIPGTSFYMYDVTGRLKQSGEITQTPMVLDIENLVPGVYFISTSHPAVKATRFIKN